MMLAACADSIDADGDGLPGFPTDPGCTSADDTDETDDCPSGPNCPACANNVDDDGDGAVDFPLDPACVAASSTTELPVDTVPAGAPCDPTGLQCEAGYICLGTCNPAACNDGVDADGDGMPGYPTDPGCTSTQDNDETDDCPSGPNCPQCSNGLDDDGDRATDYPVDEACTAASSNSELPIQQVGPGGPCNPALNQCGTGFACVGPSGLETCGIAACNDHIDADGDGFPGYPTDPGCTSISDNAEDDNCPSGPGCPTCSDALDNDGDGSIDYPMDLDCASAADQETP